MINCPILLTPIKDMHLICPVSTRSCSISHSAINEY